MTATESGYAYQIRYALWRATWIAAGRDPLSGRARFVRVEYPLRDNRGKTQSIDVLIEDADGHPLELIETKEHDSFLPLDSLESFLRRADAMRGAVPPAARFRFVCNEKLTAGVDLEREAERARALQSRGIAALDGADVEWELGAGSKSSLVDRTLVLLASDGGDALDLYCRLYARAHAQLAMRRPKHKSALRRDAQDLLAGLYTAGEHRSLPRVSGEPALDVEDIRDTMARLARDRPPAQGMLRSKLERALRRHLFRDEKITTEQIFVEPGATITSTHQRSSGSESRATPLLLRWLVDLREGRESRQPLLLIGTFGVGKSTLLTMAAHALLDVAEWVTPVLIPLRDLAGLGDEGFRPVLERYVYEEYGIDLSRRPAGDSLRYLLLCDGFDELNLYYARVDQSEWAARVCDALSFLARRPDIGVVLSSRPLATLHRRESQAQLELHAFGREQIEQWCANYRRARPAVDGNFNYETLRTRGLADVAATPLILYMIALLYEDRFLTREHYTRTDIFRTFIDWTEKGGYKGEEQDKHRLPREYRLILQDIAWLLFHSDAGYLPEDEVIAELRKTYGDVTRDAVRVDSNLLVAHMLQPARGSKGPGRLIEFTHQSFREYLVAERIWRLLEPARKEKPPHDFWVGINGAFTSAEVAFLSDMVRTTTADEALNLYGALIDAASVMSYFEEPYFSALGRSGRALVVEHDIGRRAMLAFLLMVRLYRHLEDLVPKKELPPPPEDRTFRSLLDFVSAVSPGVGEAQRLLLENLHGLRFAPEAELSNVELADADLSDVKLVDANFKRAVLVGCNIEHSTFRRCDFSHASISTQYLFRSKFIDCNFTAAEIHIENELELGTTWHNDFSGSNFTDAVFTGLVIRHNRFVGNDWTRARIEAEPDALRIERCTLDRKAARFFRTASRR